MLTNFFNLLALGRRQPPYIVLRLSGDLCFGKQLLGSCYCNLRNKALLLPKLRSHFAEFLRESYLAPLSTLPTHLCRLWYRHSLFMTVQAFLGSMT